MNIDLSNWGWPQYTYMALSLLTLIGTISLNGTPRRPYNGYAGLSNFMIAFVLLTAGGFFA